MPEAEVGLPVAALGRCVKDKLIILYFDLFVKDLTKKIIDNDLITCQPQNLPKRAKKQKNKIGIFKTKMKIISIITL